MKSALLTCIMLAFANLSMAQTEQPPSSNPSSASSPHQRNTTSKDAKEAQPTQSPEPAAASTPHQKHATADSSKAKHDKMINDCITKRQSETASLSKDAAKKACEAEMKKQR